MPVNVHQSVFSYQHSIFPKFRVAVNENVRNLFCRMLKAKYDSLDSRTTVLMCDSPKDEFFPESMKEQFRELGYEIPDIHEEGPPDEQGGISCIEVDLINMEKMDVLNQAAEFGCSWAIKEIARLFVHEAH